MRVENVNNLVNIFYLIFLRIQTIRNLQYLKKDEIPVGNSLINNVIENVIYYLDGSVQGYPPNLLRNNSNTTQSSGTLTNESHLENQSYNTAIDDRSFPPLSSTPQVDNE